MLTDYTKIPFGYGNVRIEFDDDILLFKVSQDKNQWYKEIPVFDYFVNLDVEVVKEIIGYHFEFNLDLIDSNLENQDNIINFWHYYNINTNSDKHFKIYPVYSPSLMQLPWHSKMEFIVLLKDRGLSNLLDKKRNGEILHLEMETKIMIPAEQYDTVVYRDRKGDWGIVGLSGGKIGSWYNTIANSTDGFKTPSYS